MPAGLRPHLLLNALCSSNIQFHLFHCPPPPLQLFSPDAGFGFDSRAGSAAATPRTATESLGGDASSALLSPQVCGVVARNLAAATSSPGTGVDISSMPLSPQVWRGVG